MLRRNGLALMAACAAMACAGLVRAADDAVSYSQPVRLDEPAAAPADAAAPAETPRAPLMAGLDAIGLAKPLDQAGINIYGYVEGSYQHDFSAPPDLPGGPTNFINGRAFDVQSDVPNFNQLDLTVERTVDPTKGKFDIGFRVEQIYGEDSAFIHSNGMTVYAPDKIGLARHPKVQYELNQAYLSFAIPVGNGLGIQIGKFNTLLGYELISPNANALFSHSFLFTQLPFTHTGVLVSYNLTKDLSVTGGVTRGWDQALEDVNGSIDATGQVKWAHDKVAMYLNFITGSEQPSGFNNTWRTLLDAIATYQYSDNLLLAVNGDYGWEPGIDAGKTGQWYGVALYAKYKFPGQDVFTLNVRGEWFDDQDGSAPGTFTGAPNQYYEATVGLSITPMPLNNIGKNLVIRPEVRYDYSDKPAWDFVSTPGGGLVATDSNRLTAAVDVYFTF